ncbi:MAG TPA: FAD-dependent oxidoreductase [Candidatus Eremiobacteraceae bacterium]|nr:FAD-dependent oxidoreductase [Candidatus Eremiobacteraceae bacterium]
MNDFEVAIVGGGVAGQSAALFLGRAGVRTVILDAGESSLRRVAVVNNYLGFPEGVGGAELLELGRRQVERFGAEYRSDGIESVARAQGGFSLESAGGAIACRFLILATNKRTDLAVSLGLELGGFGAKFVSVDASGMTAVPDCYAVGRITGLPSQASISSGDGARVAIGLIQRIRGGYYVDHDT